MVVADVPHYILPIFPAIAALIVGLAAWAMMLWCMVAYRRRKNDQGYPRQMAYNVPLETLFTVIPIIMVLTLWGFTDRVQRSVDTPVEDSPLTVQVYGKQWAWDFNYLDEDVYETGVHAQDVGEEAVSRPGAPGGRRRCWPPCPRRPRDRCGACRPVAA